MLLKLFLTFLKIGAVSFGGGYGMIALVREEVLSNGWLTEAEFLNFIAVSESTPGPLAVNMATFVGSAQGGFWGALLATLGVVLPAFTVISVIVAILKNAVKYKGVRAVLNGILPATAALVTATGITLLSQHVAGISHVGDAFIFDGKGAMILLAIMAIAVVYKKLHHKPPPPICMILVSAILGVVVF